MISIIFPAYNEEGSVAELHRRLVAVMKQVGGEYEIIAVDDGSKDKTADILEALAPIKVIRLAYNAGQSAALDAGIRQAGGDLIVVIDADLQNDPEDIPSLLEKMREGYDAVVGWRQGRLDTRSRRIFSKFANFVVRKISGLYLHDYGCALRVFKRKDLEDVRLYGAMHIYIPVILAERGAKIAEVPARHHSRHTGVSKYPIWQMISIVADLLTIRFFYLHSKRPLAFFGKWSLVSVAISFLFCVWSVFVKLKIGLGFSQTPLPILAAMFFMLGVVLAMVGFIAEVLIRIYYESQGRSSYKIAGQRENK